MKRTRERECCGLAHTPAGDCTLVQRPLPPRLAAITLLAGSVTSPLERSMLHHWPGHWPLGSTAAPTGRLHSIPAFSIVFDLPPTTICFSPHATACSSHRRPNDSSPSQGHCGGSDVVLPGPSATCERQSDSQSPQMPPDGAPLWPQITHLAILRWYRVGKRCNEECGMVMSGI